MFLVWLTSKVGSGYSMFSCVDTELIVELKKAKRLRLETRCDTKLMLTKRAKMLKKRTMLKTFLMSICLHPGFVCLPACRP